MSNLAWPERLELPAHTYVPSSWEPIPTRLPRGTVVVLGASDSGKTTFAKYLYSQLRAHGQMPGYLDCDVGQSTLGLPTTLNLAIGGAQTGDRKTFTYFAGDISPRGHMLRLVIGAHKLHQRAQQLGTSAVIVDTTGLVDAAVGGVALKGSLIELLSPVALVALKRDTELDDLLRPYRHDSRLEVLELSILAQSTVKSREARVQHRHQRWFGYFHHAGCMTLSLRRHSRLPFFGLERARPGHLLAFQDKDGFALGLGILEAYDRQEQELVLRTPATDLKDVHSLQMGALRFHLGDEIREWPHVENPALYRQTPLSPV